MTALQETIEDTLAGSLDTEVNVMPIVGLDVRKIELATREQIVAMVELCEQTWREVDARNTAQDLHARNGVSSTFAACYDKGSMVAFAAYGFINNSRCLMVDLLATSERYPHAIFPLAAYFHGRMKHNNAVEFDVRPQPEIRRDRKSKCTLQAGVTVDTIEHTLAAIQSLHLGAPDKGYTVAIPTVSQYPEMVRLHNSIWEDALLHESHLGNTGDTRRNISIVVTTKKGLIVGGAVVRVNKAESSVDVPVNFVDPWHAGAMRNLAISMESLREHHRLHGVRLRGRTLVNQQQRDEYASLLKTIKRFADRAKDEGGLGTAIETCKAVIGRLKMSSSFGVRVQELWEFLFEIPIDCEATRQILLIRAQRFVHVIESVSRLAHESNQNIFLTEAQLGSASSARASLIENPLKHPTVQGFTDRVPESLQHLVTMPQGSHMLTVEPSGSSGAAAIMTPPSTAQGREFQLHCFLPRPSRLDEQRAGGAILAREILTLFMEKQPYRDYLVNAYPMRAK